MATTKSANLVPTLEKDTSTTTSTGAWSFSRTTSQEANVPEKDENLFVTESTYASISMSPKDTAAELAELRKRIDEFRTNIKVLALEGKETEGRRYGLVVEVGMLVKREKLLSAKEFHKSLPEPCSRFEKRKIIRAAQKAHRAVLGIEKKHVAGAKRRRREWQENIDVMDGEDKMKLRKKGKKVKLDF